MEIELKFQIAPDQLKPLREALAARSPGRIRHRAHYFDTADGALHHHGLSLRLRKEGRAWIQTLKVGDGAAIARQEHDAPIPSHGAVRPKLDLDRHQGTDAHQRLLDVVGAHAELAEVFSTTTERLTLDLASGSAQVELAFDTGSFLAAGHQQPVRQVEFELKRGTPADLFDLALPWVERFGLRLDVKSKSERGHLLARGRTVAPPTHAHLPDAVPGEPRAFVQAVVATCLDQILRNAGDVADGSDDPDHVHQLRVGLRRLRTALRELPQLNARLDPGWESVIADAFRELGKHRDATILTSDTTTSLAQAGAPLSTPHAPARPDLTPAALVTGAELQRTFLALLQFVQEEPGDAALAFEGDAIDAVAARLDKLHRQIRRSAKGFLAMPAEDQHSVRKRLKRLRYLAEFLAPAFPKAGVSAYFKALKPAQNALGEHNDEATALDHFRDQTRQDTKAWFAVGWLTARQEVSARASAKALREAGEAKPFWTKKRHRKNAASHGD